MRRSKNLNEILTGAQGMCPVPGCGHVFRFYTQHHAETAHGMSREEVFKKYGPPYLLVQKPHKGMLARRL